ncbi:MAG: hypothetical protein IPH07_18240 [Deltaproteobacteria bacterium]|nr:hypothetical protein [Deltaproteobacteria bacterium]MBK8715641.1 hypothetical protein [Deltaproteobacteria bacterium]
MPTPSTVLLAAIVSALEPATDRTYRGPTTPELDAGATTHDDASLAAHDETTASPREPAASAATASATAPPPSPPPAATSEPIVSPTLLGEIDARTLGDAVEGTDGFALGRFRLGARVRPAPWFDAVATLETVGTAVPYLLDGYVVFRPQAWLEIGAGYAKTPLFPSFRYEPVHALPFPDRAPVVNAMRVRRDVGAEVRVRPERAPIEAVVRAGNGSGGLSSNDNRTPAGYAAVDLVLGRAWVAGHNRRLGLRLGAAGLVDEAPDRAANSGRIASGYTFWKGGPTRGRRLVGELHAVAYLGPVRITAEAGFADEARTAIDDDADAETPRVTLPSLRSWGLTGEIAWVVLGTPREVGRAPAARAAADAPWDGGALELALRVDRLALGHHAGDVADGGVTGGALAMKWWPVDFLAVALAGYVSHYDQAPMDSPGRTLSWMAMARLSAFFGYPGQSNRFRVARPRAPRRRTRA